MRLELLVSDKSLLVTIIMNKFAGLKCLTETILLYKFCMILFITRYHMVEKGCQMALTLICLHCWTNNVSQFATSLTNTLECTVIVIQ